MRILFVTSILWLLISAPALGADPSWPLPPSPPWSTPWPPTTPSPIPSVTLSEPPDWKDPSCVVYTISNSLAALHPSMNEVLQFVRNLDPKLASMEKTPGWQDFEDLKNAIAKLKAAKLDLVSQGTLEQAKKWATEAEAQLKADPKLSAIVSQVKGSKPGNFYQPGERAIKRLYLKLLYSLDREIPSRLRVPFKHLPIDPRPPKLLEAGRKIVSDQEKRFNQQFSSTGFPDEASFRNALKSMGGDYQRALNALDHGQYEFAMNRPENARWWVPKVGFQNQRTSGSSRGAMDPNLRNQVEAKLTGTKLSVYQTYDNELKPEYGYLKPTPNLGLKQSQAASQYGTDVYVFKKDRIKDRITWTGGDSFGVVQYAGEDSENPVAKNWQGFFVPWKNRSLIVPAIQDNFAAKVGFEGRWADVPFSVYTPSPPPPAPAMPTIPFPAPDGVPPRPPEPTPPPMPALSMDASMYIDPFSSTVADGASPTLSAGPAGMFPVWGAPDPAILLPPGLPSFSSPSLDSTLMSGAPASAVDAFKKWKEDTKAAMESPEHKAYEAAMTAYKSSDAYKAWDAAEKAYETGPAMTAYKDARAAYDKAMSEYYTSDAFKAYSEAESKRIADFDYARAGAAFKGSPLEPFHYSKPFGYIELQYFGPVTLDDVEIFEFRQNPPSGEFLEELKKRGIKIRDGRVDPAIDWKEGTP